MKFSQLNRKDQIAILTINHALKNACEKLANVQGTDFKTEVEEIIQKSITELSQFPKEGIEILLQDFILTVMKTTDKEN